VFGILTTAVNYLVFLLLGTVLEINLWVTNAIAWIVSVIFAFITNKLFVFESKSTEKKKVLKESAMFFLARVFSLALEYGILLALIPLFKILLTDTNGKTSENTVKLIAQVLVIIANYFFSKFIIFSKKSKADKKAKE
jgi:putative flippase GtrA